MKRVFTFLLFFFFITNIAVAQQFVRIGQLPLPGTGETGFGNVLAGLDIDGDGKPEIYAVNNNWSDAGPELVPKIFKFEYDGLLGWDLVWQATLPVPLQNTWPALTYGDWDNDGRMEIIWGPVNFTNSTSNPNPPRIVVYEYSGSGDALGVPDPAVPGNYLPNAQWSITSTDNFNLRPMRWELVDFTGDGTKELVYFSRVQVAGAGNRFGVVRVSNIPNNGDGSETWTLLASDEAGAITEGVAYDMFVVDNYMYIAHNSGAVTPISHSAGTYTIHPTLPGLITGGSWDAACVVDIDGNGSKEVVTGSFNVAGQKITLLTGAPGTNLVAHEIADLSGLIGANASIRGGRAADLDGDGKVDFVFGTRDANPNSAIVRLKYMGGDVTSPASYVASIIDHSFATAGGRWSLISIGNVDGDPDIEVVYGEATGEAAPLVIIDRTGQVPVELAAFSANVSANEVTLNWTTVTELNNNGFEIQRKSDQYDFITVGFVKGFGNTVEPNQYTFVDKNIVPGKYTYRLKQIDFDGRYEYSEAIEVDMNVPVAFRLEQNYPNPFNPTTTITYGLATDATVYVKVYNLLGEEVAALVNGEMQTAGTYSVMFNASNLVSGTYIYTLQAAETVISNKMILMK